VLRGRFWPSRGRGSLRGGDGVSACVRLEEQGFTGDLGLPAPMMMRSSSSMITVTSWIEVAGTAEDRPIYTCLSNALVRIAWGRRMRRRSGPEGRGRGARQGLTPPPDC
jgi:hypothetical protein